MIRHLRYTVVWLLEHLCWAADRIPCREEGRWYRVSGYGCRLGIARRSDRLDQRWQTGYWRDV